MRRVRTDNYLRRTDLSPREQDTCTAYEVDGVDRVDIPIEEVCNTASRINGEVARVECFEPHRAIIGNNTGALGEEIDFDNRAPSEHPSAITFARHIDGRRHQAW